MAYAVIVACILIIGYASFGLFNAISGTSSILSYLFRIF